MSHELLTVAVDEIDRKGHRVFSGYWYDKKGINFLKDVVGDETFILPMSTAECATCGKYLSWKWDNTANCIVSSDDCLEVDIQPYQVTLSVPSGKIVFADNLFPIFPELEEIEAENYNSCVGQRNYAQELAEKGMVYGAVLNTCPSLFLNTKTNAILIANPGWDKETEDEIVPEDCIRIGGVTTDLWAYSIVDYDMFIEAAGKDADMQFVEVAEVPKGTYTFTHYAGLPDFDWDADSVLFAEASYSPEL